MDRHENIGRGYIGVEGFRRLVNHPAFSNLPMILETPMGLTDQEEVELLYSLITQTGVEVCHAPS